MARGGKRDGAGRKLGALTKRTRDVAERAMATGKTPLEIMLENMRHFQQVALDAEAVLDGLTVQEITGENMTPDEQFKLLLAKAKNAAGLRQMATECARDAAPFMHAKLSSVQHSGDPEHPVEMVTRVERHIVDPQENFEDIDGESIPAATDPEKV